MIAEYLKRLEVGLPDGDIAYMDVYRDPSTERVFGIDVEYIEEFPPGSAKIVSPFNKYMILELTE